MPTHRVHIAGSTGRLGAELAALVQHHPDLTLTPTPDDAHTLCVALPRHIAHTVIDTAGDRTVIDLSGHLKAQNTGRYALLTDPTHALLLDGSPPRPGDRLANPGCIASAVILGVRSRLAHATHLGPLHISAIGGHTMAGRDQDGALRLARRLGSTHPHLPEISRALPHITISTLTAAIAYPLERGILALVSGHAEGIEVTDDGPAELDVQSALHSPRVLTHLHVEPPHVTLAVAIDNLTLPAHNALRLIEAVM